jgi:hypothetical protein
MHVFRIYIHFLKMRFLFIPILLEKDVAKGEKK